MCGRSICTRSFRHSRNCSSLFVISSKPHQSSNKRTSTWLNSRWYDSHTPTPQHAIRSIFNLRVSSVVRCAFVVVTYLRGIRRGLLLETGRLLQEPRRELYSDLALPATTLGSWLTDRLDMVGADSKVASRRPHSLFLVSERPSDLKNRPADGSDFHWKIAAQCYRV